MGYSRVLKGTFVTQSVEIAADGRLEFNLKIQHSETESVLRYYIMAKPFIISFLNVPRQSLRRFLTDPSHFAIARPVVPALLIRKTPNLSTVLVAHIVGFPRNPVPEIQRHRSLWLTWTLQCGQIIQENWFKSLTQWSVLYHPPISRSPLYFCHLNQSKPYRCPAAEQGTPVKIKEQYEKERLKLTISLSLSCSLSPVPLWSWWSRVLLHSFCSPVCPQSSFSSQ